VGFDGIKCAGAIGIQSKQLLAIPIKCCDRKEWIAQIEAETARVTDIQVTQTATGLDIIFVTAEGKLLAIDPAQFRTAGNDLIANIPNAMLTWPNASNFRIENPTAEILAIQIVQQDANRIRVTVSSNNNRAWPVSHLGGIFVCFGRGLLS
jgi:AMIN domain